MTEFVLRPAEPTDVDAIVDVFLRCWRESYATVLAPEVIRTMDDASARTLWARVITLPGGILVAEAGGRTLGVTRFLAGPDEPGYVASLYVSPDAQGMGVGGALLSAAERELRGLGARDATLWVFRDNAPSIAFYSARGWTLDGGTRVEEQFGAEEVRMSKVLG